MAQNSILGDVKDKVVGAVSRFFGLNVSPRKNRRSNFAARNAGFTPQEEETENAWNEGAESAETWQGDARAWQPPQQNPYQAPQANPNPPQVNYPPQQEGAYQAPQTGAPQSNPYQNTNPYQAAQNAPRQDSNLVYFPGAERAEENFSARVISARGVSDCYSAITQLRQGDMVVLVMDHISDPAEMRHYVDMLSGACYSLRATITKLSRHGAYLICPSKVRVYVDASTNQLNSASRQPQRPLQNPYGQSRANASMGYGDPYQNAQAAYQNGPAPYQNNPSNPQMRYANGIQYYGRQAAPEAQGTANELQPYASGYTPDGVQEEAAAL